MKKSIIILSALVLLIIIITLQNCKTNTSITRGAIKGYVFIAANDRQDKDIVQIFLPDVLVTIINSTGIVVDSQYTALDGSYRTKHLPIGKYTISFDKAGFITTTHSFSIDQSMVYTGPLPIRFDSKHYAWGTALLNDGSPGYYHQQVFGVDYFTTLYFNNDSTSSVRCNIYGYYFMPLSSDVGTLKASCQQIEDQKPVIAGNNRRVNLTFKNSNPLIEEIRAFDNSQFIQRTHTNAAVTLQSVIHEPDNDSLTYMWKINGQSFTGTESLLWQTPTDKGLYSVDMMVLDNKGGAAYYTYTIDVGEEKVSFSGTVKDILTNANIPDAKVTVNGKYSTQTDTHGNFSFSVPQSSRSDRYVLNIEKLDYCLISKIFFASVIAKEYNMVPSFTKTFDPTHDIVLIEEPDKFTQFTQVVNVLSKDGNKFIRKETKRSPARVAIKANTIVDSLGNQVTSQVTVSIRAIDVFNEKGLLPGDYGAIENGNQKRLESFGAVDVQIRDKVNPSLKYKLSPTGQPAEISSPVSSILQAAATNKQSQMQLWDYNDVTGLWEPIGKLKNTGNAFEGKTTKFSVLNADISFGPSTMMKLIDNPNHPLPTGNITVQIINPSSSGGADFKHEITINTAITNPSPLPILVPRLEPNSVVTVNVLQNGVVLNTIHPQLKGQVAGAENWYPNIQNSDYPNSNDPNVTIVKLLPDVLNGVQLNQNQLNRFLAFIENPDGDAGAQNYYRLIGALDANEDGTNNDPINFTQWKARAGFAADGSGDANTVYFNAGDLAFWRSMHQKTNNGHVYYYVTNYSNDIDAINNTTTGAIASVCMEYTPVVSGGVNFTKFFVFNGANGQLLNSANLDANNNGPNNGQKFVPGLCITCHGGEDYLNQFDATTTPAQLNTAIQGNDGMNPKFIAFDLKSFFYSTQASNTRNDKEGDFKTLNQVIVNNTNANAAIREYILASYSHTGNTLNGSFIDNGVVTGWDTSTPINTVVPKNFYVNVVGPSCRTCHNSRTNEFLWFNETTKFSSSAGNAVCSGSTRIMPNSKIAFINFWTSENPQRYEEVRKYLNRPACTLP